MSKLTNAHKERIAMKNEKNTAIQRAAAAPAKAIKKEIKRLAQEQKLKLELELEREAAYKKYKKAITIRDWKNTVRYKSKCILTAYVAKLRKKIWDKKIVQITKLDKSSSNQKVILVKFYNESYSKKFYIIFPVVEKDSFKLDESIYKNYIFAKILSTLEIFNPNSYKDIIKSAEFETSNVKTILDNHFSDFDEIQVITCISMENYVYRNLIDNFSSKFYLGVSSMLNECIKHTFEKCAKTHNLDITKVSNCVYKPKSVWHYKICAGELYDTDYDSDDSDYHDYRDHEEDYDKPITFYASINYFNGCSQCNSKNEYGQKFDIGFDLFSNMNSILYNHKHYTFVNMDDLFKELLKNGDIYDKHICHNCCKKNEVEQEVSSILSKLPGLVYIGNPEYKVGFINFDNDWDDYRKAEYISIKLPIASCQDIETYNEIKIIKTIDYLTVEEPIPKDEYMKNKNYGKYYYQDKCMVQKKITNYIARVPKFYDKSYQNFYLGQLDNSIHNKDFVNKMNFLYDDSSGK